MTTLQTWPFSFSFLTEYFVCVSHLARASCNNLVCKAEKLTEKCTDTIAMVRNFEAETWNLRLSQRKIELFETGNVSLTLFCQIHSITSVRISCMMSPVTLLQL
jgi:hypothetical protein